MTNTVSLSARDLSLLRLLSWTPATAALLLRAAPSFDGEPFSDERRMRERLQALIRAGFVRSWPTAHAGGGLQNYYKLTPIGFELLYGLEAEKPPRTFFIEISPSLFGHTLRLAEVIVETVRACHVGRVSIQRFYRENALTFTVGNNSLQPDCFLRLKFGGRHFNVAFEVDQGTESLDSNAANSIRTKLQIYDAYQETLLSDWHASGKTWERPRFRTVFLSDSIDRVHHVLSLARRMACNPNRRLILAATQDSYLSSHAPIQSPIFLDHAGEWRALVDLHPTAQYLKQPIRLKQLMVESKSVW